jgi:hypothetical protein
MSLGKSVLLAIVLMVLAMSYASYRGVTFQVARTWCEHQLGIRSGGPSLKGIPHNYGPVIVPGR